jgi:hypothetical protein
VGHIICVYVIFLEVGIVLTRDVVVYGHVQKWKYIGSVSCRPVGFKRAFSLPTIVNIYALRETTMHITCINLLPRFNTFQCPQNAQW